MVPLFLGIKKSTKVPPIHGKHRALTKPRVALHSVQSEAVRLFPDNW